MIGLQDTTRTFGMVVMQVTRETFRKEASWIPDMVKVRAEGASGRDSGFTVLCNGTHK